MIPRVPGEPQESDSPKQNPGANPEWTIYSPNYDGIHRGELRPDLARREPVLSQPDLERFGAFVLQNLGVDFPEAKQQTLSRALGEVMDVIGCRSLDELYVLLSQSSRSSRIWDLLVSALTIGETYFFRNTPHFDALATKILPDLLAEREHSSRRIRIWSAGCATGEEPYSLAILLHELIPNPESWNILILATDINRNVLRKAQEGVYSTWSFRGVAKRIQDTYFQLNNQRQFVISESIKRMVAFDYLNLVQDPYPSLANNTNAMDIILCRNVTIYFTPAVTQTVLANFGACLIEGGWLIPGAAEPNMVYYNNFESRSFPGAVMYRKPFAAKPKPKSTFSIPAPVIRPSIPPPPPMPAPRAPIAPKPAAIPAKPAPDVYAEAMEQMHNGQVDEALIKLYQKLDQDPDFAPTYYALGKIYANKGNLEEAQTWCEKGIKKDKLHPGPYYTLSMIYQQTGLIEMAMDMLKKVIYLDREFVLAHYNLAQLYLHQGEKNLARKSLQNAVQLLQGKPREMPVPEGDGMVVGRLLELVEEQIGPKK